MLYHNLYHYYSIHSAHYIILCFSKRIQGGAIHEADSALFPEYVKTTKLPEDIYRHSMKRVDQLLERYRYRLCLPYKTYSW